MLKKSDLAKQFELVVQQEIKNYQDSLNFVLQSMKELKESIQQVRQESLENHALIHSAQGNLANELQSLKNACADLYQRFLSVSCDQRTINERNAFEMQDLASAFLSQEKKDNEFRENIKNISHEIKNLKDKTHTDFRVLHDNLDDLLRRFRQEILKTKTEILEAPTEASLVRAQLEEKIASHTVDVAGIMRELRIYKSDNMITQKKIENIYTLIGRLSKQEAIP